jgi:hypothetical protein
MMEVLGSNVSHVKDYRNLGCGVTQSLHIITGVPTTIKPQHTWSTLFNSRPQSPTTDEYQDSSVTIYRNYDPESSNENHNYVLCPQLSL